MWVWHVDWAISSVSVLRLLIPIPSTGKFGATPPLPLHSPLPSLHAGMLQHFLQHCQRCTFWSVATLLQHFSVLSSSSVHPPSPWLSQTIPHSLSHPHTHMYTHMQTSSNRRIKRLITQLAMTPPLRTTLSHLAHPLPLPPPPILWRPTSSLQICMRWTSCMDYIPVSSRTTVQVHGSPSTS